MRNMNKIVVIGCPGSGKSHFSRQLHNKTGIALYHLDMMYWNSDKTTVEKEVFLDRLNDVLEKESWIIDGNYISTMKLRISKCDTVIFLDYPTEICLEGVRQRRGKARDDMPWVENDEDSEFIEYIKSFNKQQRPVVMAMLEESKLVKRILRFSGREEAEMFLHSYSLEDEICK